MAPSAGIVSFDARGHGETVLQKSSKTDRVLDLSLETLADDFITMLELTQAKMAWEKLPGLILVGHSLGGAVVTHVAKVGRLGNSVLAYAVLDVVEGMRDRNTQTLWTICL
jgi:protein phosphatase methylesterase 1